MHCVNQVTASHRPLTDALTDTAMNRGNSAGKRPARPRWAQDIPEEVPSKASKASKPKGAIKKKQRKSPKPAEKPHKIEQLLQDPEKRKHLGPCCVSYDGSIRGTKKWGDYPPGSLYTDGTYFFECMGCRKILDQPPPGACGTSLRAGRCGLGSNRCHGGSIQRVVRTRRALEVLCSAP